MIWKNCNCPQYNDDDVADWVETGHQPRYRRRNIFRAERAVDRHNKVLGQVWGRPDLRPREVQIQEVRNEAENGCDHGYWHQVRMTKTNPGHCKLCKYVGHRYIYRCLFCPLTSCYACHTDEPPEYRRVEEEDQH